MGVYKIWPRRVAGTASLPIFLVFFPFSSFFSVLFRFPSDFFRFCPFSSVFIRFLPFHFLKKKKKKTRRHRSQDPYCETPIASGAKKDPQNQKNRTTSTKEYSEQFEGVTRSLPSKTKVYKQITPESSPESSAKSLSYSFFVVPFLSPIANPDTWSRKPALLNGRFGNCKIGGRKETRQPFASPSPPLCQPFRQPFADLFCQPRSKPLFPWSKTIPGKVL